MIMITVGISWASVDMVKSSHTNPGILLEMGYWGVLFFEHDYQHFEQRILQLVE